MAVQEKRETKKKSGVYSIGAGLGARTPFKIIMWIAIAIFVGLCLFGVINQARLGSGFIEGFVLTGDEIGKAMFHVAGNDSESPVDINENGVYLKGSTPTESEEEKAKEEQEKNQALEQHKKNIQDPNTAN